MAYKQKQFVFWKMKLEIKPGVLQILIIILTDSRMDGIPALSSALPTTSFRAAYLGWRPALYLLETPRISLAAINRPQWKFFGTLTAERTLRAIAERNISGSKSVSSVGVGQVVAHPTSSSEFILNLIFEVENTEIKKIFETVAMIMTIIYWEGNHNIEIIIWLVI